MRKQDITTSFEIMLGDYCIGMQFNFRQRKEYGGCSIYLLPVLVVNWNNGLCIFGIEFGWLNFNGCPYIRKTTKERKKFGMFLLDAQPQDYPKTPKLRDFRMPVG